MINDSKRSWFLNLPSTLGQNILLCWLGEKALSSLDSSICSHSERARYLEMLNSCPHLSDVFSNFTSANIRGKMIWMVKRNFRCSAFCFHHQDIPDMYCPEMITECETVARSFANVSIRGKDHVLAYLLKCIASSNCSLNTFDMSISSFNMSVTAQKDFHTILCNSSATLTELCATGWERGFTLPQLDTDSGKLSALRVLQTGISCNADLVSICVGAPNLQEITLMYIGASDICFEPVGHYCKELISLKIFDMQKTIAVPIDTGVAAIAQGCQKLQHLVLSMCKTLTDTGLISVANHCGALTYLKVSGNDLITDASLVELAICVAERLLSLQLDCCQGIVGTSLMSIATHCTNLRTLDISYNTRVTVVENLTSAVPYLRNLQILNMPNCKVDDALLSLISEHMPDLLYLDITATDDPAYTFVGLSAIVQNCAQLQQVIVNEEIPEVSVLAAKLRPQLYIFAIIA